LITLLKENFIPVLLGLIIFIFFSASLFAAETDKNKGPINIEAESMSYDNNSDVYQARGAVVITYNGGVLTADAVELDNKNNIATASGNARLKMGDDSLAGDKIIFNISSKTGVVYQGRAFYARNHFYIRGDKIEKTGELTYRIEKPVATTCDGDKPAWEITGSEMNVTIEGYGLMKDAKLTAGDVPVFYSPFLPFPAKTKRQSGFLFPYLAYSRDKNGIDIEVPYFWAISETMDATFYQRFMEKRGFKEGVEFRYYAGANSFGTFYGDYMEDTKQIQETVGSNSRDWQDMHKRWSFYLNHQTNFDPQSYIRADLRRVSDNWYFRDFSAANYYRDHYAPNDQDPFRKISFTGDESLRSLESTVRLYKGWSNYSLGVLASSTDDFAAANNNLTLQRYPEVTFTGIRQPLLKTPLFYELSAVYDYFYRGEGQKGHFFDFAPTISLPINISHYAKVTPQIMIRETYWNRDDNDARGDYKEGSRTLYTASLSVSSQMSRIFDVQGKSWDKIRHEIKPEITYSYIPNIGQDKIPDYIPAVIEQNGITWSLTNTFTAKIKDATGAFSYLEFLRIKLFQTYDINEARKGMEGTTAERRPLSDIWLETDLKPHKYFSFSARNQYNVYTGWKVTNYDLNISDWRNDNLTIGYRYTLDSIEEINLSLKAVINKYLDSMLIVRRDQLNSKTIESTVGLLYHHQCWAVGFDFTQTDTDTRYVLKLSLTGLGKWGL
jgi:LPS-assembly protein